MKPLNKKIENHYFCHSEKGFVKTNAQNFDHFILTKLSSVYERGGERERNLSACANILSFPKNIYVKFFIARFMD